MLTTQQTWISTEEAAEIIGCHPNHVRLLCRQEKLKAQQISGVWVIDQDSAKAFAATEQVTGRPRGS